MITLARQNKVTSANANFISQDQVRVVVADIKIMLQRNGTFVNCFHVVFQPST